MILNPFLEIRTKVSGDINQYYLIDYLNRKKYVIDNQMLILICKLYSMKDLDKRVIDSNGWGFLIDNRLVVDENEHYVSALINIRKKWEHYNWKEAFKYYLSTLNYPFEGNLETASKIMKQYGEEEEDSLRDKKYVEGKYSLLDIQKFNVQDVAFDKYDQLGITKDKVLLLISFIFGYVKQGKPSWQGKSIYHRTTPSGGARQPTQGYLYVIDIPGIKEGWYYINGKDLVLEPLNRDKFDVERLVVLNSNYNIKSGCLIVLTSLFEKNMYRYREPRTYRTIHMDVGHIMGLAENLSSRMGMLALTQYGMDDEYIESILKLNFLEEGYQATIVLGTLE